MSYDAMSAWETCAALVTLCMALEHESPVDWETWGSAVDALVELRSALSDAFDAV